MNNDVMRYLAKMQGDDEPAIRANATICLGKISHHLNQSVRRCYFSIHVARVIVDVSYG